MSGVFWGVQPYTALWNDWADTRQVAPDADTPDSGTVWFTK